MVGLPNFLSMTTLRPFGPIVALTAAARMLTPRSRAARPSSLNITCLGMLVLLLGRFDGMDRTQIRSVCVSRGPASREAAAHRARVTLLDDAEHVLFAQDQILLVLDLHLGPGVLAEQDLVAGLHVQGDPLAVVPDLAVAHRDDLALLGLLLRGVGDDNAALPDLLLLHRLAE